MKKKKGKYYQGNYPGDKTIILCTESSNAYIFSGVCIRKGNNTNLGDHSTSWTSGVFDEIDYNEISTEEKIHDELLFAKKKLTKCDEVSSTYKCAQSKIHLLETLNK